MKPYGTLEPHTYRYYVSVLIKKPREGMAAISTHLLERDGPVTTEREINELAGFLEDQNPHLGKDMVIIGLVRLDGEES